MDARLQVTDLPREAGSKALAEMPLVTIAWRALRAEYQRRADERKDAETEARRGQHALVSIAEEMYRLRRTTQIILPALEEVGKHSQGKQLLAIADRMQEALASLDVTIVAPEGEPYTTDLMELLDNVAQRPEPGALVPRVAEVITPTIMHRGALLRMGKAVIAVPIGRDETVPGDVK